MALDSRTVTWLSSVVTSSLGAGLAVFFVDAFDSFSWLFRMGIFFFFSAFSAVALWLYFSPENTRKLDNRKSQR